MILGIAVRVTKSARIRLQLNWLKWVNQAKQLQWRVSRVHRNVYYVKKNVDFKLYKHQNKPIFSVHFLPSLCSALIQMLLKLLQWMFYCIVPGDISHASCAWQPCAVQSMGERAVLVSVKPWPRTLVQPPAMFGTRLPRSGSQPCASIAATASKSHIKT